MSLLAVTPRPTPIELGDQTYLASELRIGDLASLEAFVRARNPNPYDIAASYLNRLDPTSLAFRALLADTIEKLATYSTELTSEKANEALSSIEGTIYFVWTVLRREHPALTLDEVGEVLEFATVEQFERINRIAWSLDPLPKLYEYIVPPSGTSEPGQMRQWAKGWFRYLTECHCGPQFHELTLTQYNCFVMAGELPDSSTVSASSDQFDFERNNKISAFFEEFNNGL